MAVLRKVPSHNPVRISRSKSKTLGPLAAAPVNYNETGLSITVAATVTCTDVIHCKELTLSLSAAATVTTPDQADFKEVTTLVVPAVATCTAPTQTFTHFGNFIETGLAITVAATTTVTDLARFKDLVTTTAAVAATTAMAVDSAHYKELTGVATPGYFTFPGGTGLNNLTTPEYAGLHNAQDFTCVARVRPSGGSWISAAPLTIGCRAAAANQWSWLFRVLNTGALSMTQGSTGTSLTGINSTITLQAAGIPADWCWVAIVFDGDNGASGKTARFWTSPDKVTWTQLGTDAISAGTVNLFNSNAGLMIGQFGNISPQGWVGDIQHFSVRSGFGAGGTVGGTETFCIDGSELTNSAATTFTAITGQLVTVNRAAVDPKTVITTAVPAGNPPISVAVTVTGVDTYHVGSTNYNETGRSISIVGDVTANDSFAHFGNYSDLNLLVSLGATVTAAIEQADLHEPARSVAIVAAVATTEQVDWKSNTNLSVPIVATVTATVQVDWKSNVVLPVSTVATVTCTDVYHIAPPASWQAAVDTMDLAIVTAWYDANTGYDTDGYTSADLWTPGGAAIADLTITSAWLTANTGPKVVFSGGRWTITALHAISINIQVSNVTLFHCLVERPPGSISGGIGQEAPYVGGIADHCTLDGNATGDGDGTYYYNTADQSPDRWTMRYCDTSGYRAGYLAYFGCTAEYNWTHDLYIFGDSHNTAMSIRGQNCRAYRCFLADGNSAALSLYAENTPYTGIVLQENVFAHYGHASSEINFPSGKGYEDLLPGQQRELIGNYFVDGSSGDNKYFTKTWNNKLLSTGKQLFFDEGTLPVVNEPSLLKYRYPDFGTADAMDSYEFRPTPNSTLILMVGCQNQGHSTTQNPTVTVAGEYPQTFAKIMESADPGAGDDYGVKYWLYKAETGSTTSFEHINVDPYPGSTNKAWFTFWVYEVTGCTGMSLIHSQSTRGSGAYGTWTDSITAPLGATSTTGRLCMAFTACSAYDQGAPGAVSGWTRIGVQPDHQGLVDDVPFITGCMYWRKDFTGTSITIPDLGNHVADVGVFLTEFTLAPVSNNYNETGRLVNVIATTVGVDQADWKSNTGLSVSAVATVTTLEQVDYKSNVGLSVTAVAAVTTLEQVDYKSNTALPVPVVADVTAPTQTFTHLGNFNEQGRQVTVTATVALTEQADFEDHPVDVTVVATATLPTQTFTHVGNFNETLRPVPVTATVAATDILHRWDLALAVPVTATCSATGLLKLPELALATPVTATIAVTPRSSYKQLVLPVDAAATVTVNDAFTHLGNFSEVNRSVPITTTVVAVDQVDFHDTPSVSTTATVTATDICKRQEPSLSVTATATTSLAVEQADFEDHPVNVSVLAYVTVVDLHGSPGHFDETLRSTFVVGTITLPTEQTDYHQLALTTAAAATISTTEVVHRGEFGLAVAAVATVTCTDVRSFHYAEPLSVTAVVTTATTDRLHLFAPVSLPVDATVTVADQADFEDHPVSLATAAAVTLAIESVGRHEPVLSFAISSTISTVYRSSYRQLALPVGASATVTPIDGLSSVLLFTVLVVARFTATDFRSRVGIVMVNDADAIFLGEEEVFAVYAGADRAWP